MEPQSIDFSGKHKTHISIRFPDIDAMGHANNAKHITYLEEARIQYFEDVLGGNIEWKKEGIILARIEYNFVNPIYLRDNLNIYTWCAKIGNKSFHLHHRVIKQNIDGTETIIGEAQTVLVCYDYQKEKSIEVPQVWIDKISQFEGSSLLLH